MTQRGRVPARGRSGQEVRVVLVQAAAHRRQLRRRCPQRGVEAGRVDRDDAGAGPQRLEVGRRRRRPGRPAGRSARPGRPAASATRPNAVSEWCDTPRCRSRGIGVREPQRADRPAAEHRHRVHDLAGGHAGESPRRAGAEVARALGDDRDIGRQHVPGRQQPGVHGDRLEIAAERLPGAHRAAQQRHAARRPCASTTAAARRRRSARRRSAPSGRSASTPATTAGRAECRSAITTGMPSSEVAAAITRVVGRVLLVHPEHGGLGRRVAGLDDVTGSERVGRQPIGQRRPRARARRCPVPSPARSC